MVKPVSPAPSFRLDHTKFPSAQRRNSFHSSLRANGTANIGIVSQGLIASDQQVWCPSLQQVAGKTPASPFIERQEEQNVANRSETAIHLYRGVNERAWREHFSRCSQR